MGKWFSSAIIVASFVAIASGEVRAQPEVDTHWMGNFRFGYSNAQFYGGEALMRGDARNGIAAMISGELVLNENIGWEFGVGMVQKGVQGQLNASAAADPDDPVDEDLDFDGDIKLGYVTLNVQVNGYLPVGYSGKLRGYGGMGLGLIVNSQAIGTLNSQPVELDLDDAVKGEDLYGVVGAGYSYAFSNRMELLIDFRVEIGLVSIDDTALDSGVKNTSYQGLIGLGIPIGVGGE